MTISANIKCDTCERVFTLKTQADESINIYDWPIELVCPACNNPIHLLFNRHDGITPAKLKCDAEGEVTHVGYSATLPVIDESYYKIAPTSFSPFYSSFMNLYMILGQENLNKHKFEIDKLLEGIIPYRQLLKETLPLMQKENNTKAFLTKVANFFNEEHYTIDETKESRTAYNEFVECVYNGLCTPEYISQRCSYYNELLTFVNGADSSKLRNVITISEGFYNIDDWLLLQAYPHIAEMTAHLEKYLPAIFYSSIGSFAIPHYDKWNILTIDHEQAAKDYADGFEILNKILPFMVALHNMMRNNDCTHFKENGLAEHHDAMAHFNGTFGAQRKNEIETYPTLKEYFEYVFENKIRNGNGHRGIQYDVHTQTISFHHNANNPEAIHKERLIDVCLRVYLQMMRIIEITLILNEIKNKTR